MNNNLMVFENENFGAVRAIDNSGEVFFSAKEIVEVLGYKKNYTHVIKQHVDEEDYVFIGKETHAQNGHEILEEKTHPQNGAEFKIDYKELGQRGGYLINESGMYALIFGSKLKEAKQFKRWVTKEVLPTIRKTGGYVQDANKFTSEYFPELDGVDRDRLIENLYSYREQHKEKINELYNHCNNEYRKLAIVRNLEREEHKSMEEKAIAGMQQTMDTFKNVMKERTELIKKVEMYEKILGYKIESI